MMKRVFYFRGSLFFLIPIQRKSRHWGFHLIRFQFQVPHPIFSTTLAADQKSPPNFTFSADFRPGIMGYCRLVDFHSFPLTKQFPITSSAIYPIGTPSTFCIDKTAPGFLDVIWMSHCRIPATDGAEFWISCNRLKELRKAGRLQTIQNKCPWCWDAA